MPSVHLDLSEFENPRPSRSSERPQSPRPASPVPSSSASDSSQHHPHDDSSHTRQKKRKLPYRAAVVLEGRRYKGKRVSRRDADLEPEAFELPDHFSRSDHDSSDKSISDGVLEVGDDLPGLDDARQDEEQIISSRAERLKAEERAVAARLVEVEKREITRAHVVRKQKDLYDAVVNFRIRVQNFVSLARQFPSNALREGCSSWTPDEELSDSMKMTESSVSSLAKQACKAYCATWPSSQDKHSDKDFEKWRNTVLDHWGSKVDEASGAVPKGGFKTIDTTVSAQVKASLASGKHLAKTQRVRESFSLLGDGLEMLQGSNELEYDDGDFYRILLREIIESGEAAGGGLQYSKLSKGGKVKKKRDRSYAKGRRLKYDVHEKLVGFLAPIPLPDGGPVDEIVAALFGRRGSMPSTA